MKRDGGRLLFSGPIEPPEAPAAPFPPRAIITIAQPFLFAAVSTSRPISLLEDDNGGVWLLFRRVFFLADEEVVLGFGER